MSNHLVLLLSYSAVTVFCFPRKVKISSVISTQYYPLGFCIFSSFFWSPIEEKLQKDQNTPKVP